jgi:glycosyltransferase involved in cell wall biosynthesis
MPAYNAGRFIGAALESVLAQTRPPAEVVVVNDGSTDETAAIAQRFGPRVVCVTQANARQAAARNRGIRETQGEVLAFIDADDLWEPDKLERQLEVLRRSPDVGLVYCSVLEIDEAGRAGRVCRAQLRGAALRGILLGLSGGICGSTPMIPRRVLDEVGLFDEGLPPCEDTDLFWRIAARHPIDFVDAPLVRYRLHAGNDHANVDKMARAWTALYDKALRAPEVRALGWSFRRKVRGRLGFMLSGDYARTGRRVRAVSWGLFALAQWPFLLFRIAIRGLRRG